MLLTALWGCAGVVDYVPSETGEAVVGPASAFGAWAETSRSATPPATVVLQSGDPALVGMDNVLCAVDPSMGTVGTDYFFSGSGDTLHDADGSSALISTDEGLYFAPLPVDLDGSYGDGVPDWDLSGVMDAIFTDDGVVLAHLDADGCHVEGESGSVIDLGDCETVSLSEGPHGVIATVDGFPELLEGDGTSEVAVDGDVLVWDPASEVLWVGSTGSETLQGLEASGDLRFEVALPGGLVDLTVVGAVGTAMVLVEGQSLLEVSGDDGTVLSGFPVDDSTGVVADPGGRRIARLRENEVVFYQR